MRERASRPTVNLGSMLCRLVASLCLVVAARASHCYNYDTCTTCVGNSVGAPCAWCNDGCQMASDVCAGGAVQQAEAEDAAQRCEAGAQPYVPPPGVDFFSEITGAFRTNPAQRNYGVAITDVDGDDKFEALVTGFGVANQLLRFDQKTSQLVDIAEAKGLQDKERKAIGVAACDADGDGIEEIYVLNTDQYSGTTSTSDRLYRTDQSSSTFSDLFELPQNSGEANYVAGRSCACVDGNGDGKYEVMVANYGGPMRLFQVDASTETVTDIAASSKVDRTTGGRALVAGPILTNRFDIFANNEGPSNRRRSLLSHRANYMFENNCDGGSGNRTKEPTFAEVSADVGVRDASNTGRGTALLDANRDGLIDIVYGNWRGEHRLFLQSRDNDDVTFTDTATDDFKKPSRVRTVIAADFDNDGNEDIFFNNIPGDNRLFTKIHGVDTEWNQINIGQAREPTMHGTGAAVFDMDGDGILELIVSHGESASEPLTLYRASSNTGVSANAFLRVLPKTRGGAPARGSVVTLTPGSQMRVIDSGSGYLCQMEPVAHFGLGPDSEAADTWSVTVQFPDGVRVTKTGLAKNQLHVIEYPDDGTEVQFIGCARSSVEKSCVLGERGKDMCSIATSSGNRGGHTGLDETMEPASTNDETAPSPSTDGADETVSDGDPVALSTTSVDTGMSSNHSNSRKSFGDRSCVMTYTSVLLTALAMLLVI